MWAIFVGAVLLSLSRRDEDEEEKRRALQISGGPQLHLFPESLVDWMVPVRMWADGASMWRVVGRGVLEQLERDFGKKASWGSARDNLLASLDPTVWPDDEPEISPSESQLYVYVEGERLGMSPTVMVLVDDSAQGLFVEEVIGHVPKESFALERIYDWAKDKDMMLSSDDVERELWRDKGLVPDRAVAVLRKLEAELSLGKEGEETYSPLLASSDETTRQIGAWAKAFSELWWQLKSQNAIAKERKFWASAYTAEDEEVARQIRESVGEEDADEILGSKKKFERFVGQMVEDLDEQMREGREELLDAAEKEASAANLLIYMGKVDIVGTQRTRWNNDILLTWEVNPPNTDRNVDSIDDLQLRQDDDGRVSYDFRDSSVRNTVGALDSLMAGGYLEVESEREKRTTGVLWDFPGELKDVWEIWALTGTFRPKVSDPLVLFIRVALDHGLLSEPVRTRYEKLLRDWEDPMAKLVEHRLV